MDREIGTARSGLDNGYVRASSGWNALNQSVVVHPYTDYTPRDWVRGSANNTEGYFGAREPGNGLILGRSSSARWGAYTGQVVHFNSGPHALIEVYGGLWAENGDTWMQLDDVSLTRGSNLIHQAGFEQQPTNSAPSPWYTEGKAGIDRGIGHARTGANNAWARSNTGWNAVKLAVAVTPNTQYALTGWVKTSANHVDGYFGARLLRGGPILNEVRFTQPLSSYAQLSVSFSSGAWHSVEVFAGMGAYTGDTWIHVDDLSLTRNWAGAAGGAGSLKATAPPGLSALDGTFRPPRRPAGTARSWWNEKGGPLRPPSGPRAGRNVPSATPLRRPPWSW